MSNIQVIAENNLFTAMEAHNNFKDEMQKSKQNTSSVDAVSGTPLFLNHKMQEILKQILKTEYPELEYTKFGILQKTQNPLAQEIVGTATQGSAVVVPENSQTNVMDTGVRKFEQVITKIHAYKSAVQINYLDNKRNKAINYDSLADQLTDVNLAFAQKEDKIYLVGDQDFGFPYGLFNHPEVNKGVAKVDIYASVSSKEFDAVKGAFFKKIREIEKGSNWIIKIDTVIVPTSLYKLLQSTLTADFQKGATNVNFLTLLQDTLGITIKHSRRLPDVAIDSNHERIVLMQTQGIVSSSNRFGFYQAMPFTPGIPTNYLDNYVQFYYKSTGGFVCYDAARLFYLDTAKEA